jgi:hypothetical protein
MTQKKPKLKKVKLKSEKKIGVMMGLLGGPWNGEVLFMSTMSTLPLNIDGKIGWYKQAGLSSLVWESL